MVPSRFGPGSSLRPSNHPSPYCPVVQAEEALVVVVEQAGLR